MSTVSSTPTVTRLQALAADYRARFTQQKREDGREFWVVAEGQSTEALKNLCHHAHGDMAPDDWRYEFIVDALDALASAADPDDATERLHEYIDTADVLRWLGSYLSRVEYCDEYESEFGFDFKTQTTLNLLMGGMRTEQEEVLSLVRDGLTRHIDASLSADEEIPEGAAWDSLPSTWETPEIEARIRESWDAFNNGTVTESQPVYEHGHWWMQDPATGAIWDVVDVNDDGFAFEVVEDGDEDEGEDEAARFSSCRHCGAIIDLNLGRQAPAGEETAGTEDDPRAPGDQDDICDACDYGSDED